MTIVLNCRHEITRLEEAFRDLGHTVIYNVWDIGRLKQLETAVVVFEFKQIMKEEMRFIKLSRAMKREGICSMTWCLDMPNIGARRWKLSLLLRSGLLDIFATHSMQGLEGIPWIRSRLLYLPNAAWTSRYGLGAVTMEELRDPSRYVVDVSFLGNMDGLKHPEHRRRVEFLESLGARLKERSITYRFEDSRKMPFNDQIELIQKSRISLNVGCAADLESEISWGLPERCYGIPACGGFLLSDERKHAREEFLVGDEIVMFADLEDCLSKIEYYVYRHDERRTMAERAHARIYREHTYIQRAEKLLKAMKELGQK